MTLSFLPNLFVPQSPHFSYAVIIIARLPQRVVVHNGADTCKEWCAHLSACSASVSPQRVAGTWGRELRTLPFLSFLKVT